MLEMGRLVTLVDLDTVEPFYTLRPLKEMLESRGLKVIGFSRQDSFGLGETGAMMNPQARWVLKRDGDIIMDVGYGVHGARTLNLVEGSHESTELRIIAVVNFTRPMTNSAQRVKEYIKSLGRVDVVVANTHLGDETTIDLICDGNQKIYQAVNELGIDVAYMAVDYKFKDNFDMDACKIPVKFIYRYMPEAIW